jgi:hypothetical protein
MTEPVDFIQRSKSAYVVCDKCGRRFGRVSPDGIGWIKIGTCDICKKKRIEISDFKYYGFSKYA